MFNGLYCFHSWNYIVFQKYSFVVNGLHLYVWYMFKSFVLFLFNVYHRLFLHIFLMIRRSPFISSSVSCWLFFFSNVYLWMNVKTLWQYHYLLILSAYIFSSAMLYCDIYIIHIYIYMHLIIQFQGQHKYIPFAIF